jgi:uroporphyrinogen decarboxylase
MENKILYDVLKGRAFSPPPIWLMRQAGRYLPEYRELRKKEPNFIKFCLTPSLTLEAVLQPIRRYDLDGAILFSDILILPHALGQHVEFEEKIGPVLTPIDWKNLAHLYNKEKMLNILAPVFACHERMKASLPASVTRIGFAGGPWTVASYMVEGKLTRDLRIIKQAAYVNPQGFENFLMFLADATADYLIAQVAAGAEVLQIFDSWAGFIPEAFLDAWLIRPLRSIIDKLSLSCPDVPLVLYARGLGGYYRAISQEFPTLVLSIDQSISLYEAAKLSCVIQGNLDSWMLTTKNDLWKKEVERLLQIFENHPFVFNLSQGLFPETDPGLVLELVKFIRSQGNASIRGAAHAS